jgi:hypothetical protein
MALDVGPWTTADMPVRSGHREIFMKSIKVFKSDPCPDSSFSDQAWARGNGLAVRRRDQICGVDNAGPRNSGKNRAVDGDRRLCGASDPGFRLPGSRWWRPSWYGGRHLWILDPASGDVTACSVEYNFYGNRQVDCSSSR